MDNQQLISFIKGKVSDGSITKEEVIAALNQVGTNNSVIVEKNNNFDTPQTYTKSSGINIVNALYVIGGIIAFIGVVFLLAQNWKDIGFVGRISVTLGIAIITYISALLLNKPEDRILSQVFFLISSVLTPMGIAVLFNEYNIKLDVNKSIVISVILGLMYLFSYFVSKRNILIPLSTIYLTLTYFLVITKVVDVYGIYSGDLMKYSCMVLGLGYMLIAYYISTNLPSKHESRDRVSIKNLFYLAGSVFVMAPALSFGGFYDILFLALVFVFFYISIYVRSTLLLTVSSGFLVFDLGKITFRYFAYSIGWPITLIIAGFLVIGIGYATFKLNKKYIKSDI